VEIGVEDEREDEANGDIRAVCGLDRIFPRSGCRIVTYKIVAGDPHSMDESYVNTPTINPSMHPLPPKPPCPPMMHNMINLGQSPYYSDRLRRQTQSRKQLVPSNLAQGSPGITPTNTQDFQGTVKNEQKTSCAAPGSKEKTARYACSRMCQSFQPH
jgi:hypothetical protein